MYKLATPLLYRRMNVDMARIQTYTASLGKTNAEDSFILADRSLLGSTYGPHNRNLRHVRQLSIRTSSSYLEDHEVVQHEGQLNSLFDVLTKNIPPDTLIAYSIDGRVSLSADLLVAFHSRQRKLRNLNVGPVQSMHQAPMMTSIKALDEPLLRHLTAFQAYISDFTSVLHTVYTVRKATKLDVLELKMDPHFAGGGYSQLPGGNGAVWEFCASMLGWMRDPPSTIDWQSSPRKLRVLNIDGFNCQTIAAELLRTFDLAELESLAIQQCYNTLWLCEALADSGCLRVLKRLVLMNQDDDQRSTNGGRAALDRLLNSIDALETIVISNYSVSDVIVPSIKAIARHGKTLIMLYIEDNLEDRATYTADELSVLRDCHHLQQLAIPLPRSVWIDDEQYETVLRRERTTRFVELLVSVRYFVFDVDANKPQGSFVSNMSELRTLLFLAMPLDTDDSLGDRAFDMNDLFNAPFPREDSTALANCTMLLTRGPSLKLVAFRTLHRRDFNSTKELAVFARDFRFTEESALILVDQITSEVAKRQYPQTDILTVGTRSFFDFTRLAYDFMPESGIDLREIEASERRARNAVEVKRVVDVQALVDALNRLHFS